MKIGYNPGRMCESCGVKMPPFFPRVTVGDQKICNSCVNRMEGLLSQGLLTHGYKVAHEAPAEQGLIFHCPWCGSGQITGRSDGMVECGYCDRTFLVREQPAFNTAPQNLDGTPFEAQEAELPSLDDVSDQEDQNLEDAGADSPIDATPDFGTPKADELSITSSIGYTSALAKDWYRDILRIAKR